MGLFQDLQNVNPFDGIYSNFFLNSESLTQKYIAVIFFTEQFRRASAEATNLTSPTQSNPDDALHTPHVFPQVSLDNELPTAELPPPKLPANVRKNYQISLSTSECLTLPSPLTTPIPTPIITITGPPESPPPPSNNLNANEVPAAKPTASRKRTSSAFSVDNKNNHVPKKERAKKTSISATAASKPILSTPGMANIMPRPTVTSPPINDPLTTLLIRLPDGRLVQIPAIPVATETTGNTDVESSNTTAAVPPIIPLKAVEQPLLPSTVTPALSEAKMVI